MDFYFILSSLHPFQIKRKASNKQELTEKSRQMTESLKQMQHNFNQVRSWNPIRKNPQLRRKKVNFQFILLTTYIYYMKLLKKVQAKFCYFGTFKIAIKTSFGKKPATKFNNAFLFYNYFL